MNKIDEFEFFDLPRESDWRINHTEEHNRKIEEFQLGKQKCSKAYDLQHKMVLKVYRLNKIIDSEAEAGSEMTRLFIS